MAASDHLQPQQFLMPMHVVGELGSEYGDDEHGKPILMKHIGARTAVQQASIRYEPEDLEELADDVRERGVHTPIRIGEGGVWDGHNRYWAAAHADQTHIPVTFETDQDREHVFRKFGLRAK